MARVALNWSIDTQGHEGYWSWLHSGFSTIAYCSAITFVAVITISQQAYSGNYDRHIRRPNACSNFERSMS